MPQNRVSSAIQHIHMLIRTHPRGDWTDEQLLDRFLRRRDESAFETLVQRHGQLVFRVCRRVLNDPQAAEDAFQATFLVLARKAGSIRQRQSLGSWLYGVAYRVARKSRLQINRRPVVHADLRGMHAAEADARTPPEELRPIIDEELVHLSERYRAPLVLCYLEGKSYKQAALELGYSEGSMSRRLAQARERLRLRLVRRGLGITSIGIAAVLADSSQAAAPAALIEATVKAAAGKSVAGPAAAAAASCLREMTLAKVKVVSCLLFLGIATASVGIGLATRSGGNDPGPLVVAPVQSDAAKHYPYYHVPVVEDCLEDQKNMNELEPPKPEPLPMPAPPSNLELPERFELANRRRLDSEEELRRQLFNVPELNLDQGPGQHTTIALNTLLIQNREREGLDLIPNYLASRSDLAGLPILKGESCQLEDDPAYVMRGRSRDLRRVMSQTLDFPNGEYMLALALHVNFRRSKVFKEDFSNICAVPAMTQILSPHDATIRRVLVEQLGRIPDRPAGESLAKLALFDISPEVRAAAVHQLSRRPSAEYRETLMRGFRYPWPPVADHAAEALVALDAREMASELHVLLDLPDPSAPEWDENTGDYVVRELVRINHLRNCLMCHAPRGHGYALLSGRIPTPGKPLPPILRYYGGKGGIFVRAEITYLRQDFSVTQPVARAKPWPTMQRYDYIIRSRRVPPPHQPPPSTYPQREAVLYALRMLEGL